jgi:hypothetical protein
MSSSLIWLLTKKHNAFLVHSNGLTLSSEPNNLRNTNSRQFSGFANKTVGVELNEKGGASLTLSATNKDKQNKPAKSTYTIDYKATSGFRTVAKKISEQVKSSGRPDLEYQALARYSRLHASLHTKTGGVTKRPRRRYKNAQKPQQVDSASDDDNVSDQD